MSDQKQLFIDLEQLLLSSNKMLFEVVSSAIRMGSEIHEKNEEINRLHDQLRALQTEIDEVEERNEEGAPGYTESGY